MPLVIDICVLHKLIPKSANRSCSYQKIHLWLTSSRAKIAAGGSKYKKELSSASRYLPFFNELDRMRRLVNLNDKKVDELAREILAKVNNDDLNDEHIIAIVILSRAVGVCTSDVNLESFLKNCECYPKDFVRPRILKESTPVNRVSQFLNEKF